ncbi:MAG: trigger factor [Chloroflexi bacterium]|nr:trigger factor [Chloroflexota bacterium]
MKVTREKTESSQAFLTVEMEPVEVEEALKKARGRLSRKANIPGFRKGKAPRDILERHLGKDYILEDAINHLVPDAYEKAIKEQAIETIARPRIEVTQTEPVIFKAVVPLPPVVELGDYKTIKIKPEKVKITTQNVADVLENLRHQNATWESVDRAAAFKDLAVMDVESNLDGKPFLTRPGFQYRLDEDSAFPAPGFAAQLVGMKKDGEKEFTLKLPDDYPRSEMAGKEPSFKVKLIEIKEEKLPALNDDFARQVGPELANLAALRKEIETNLKLQAEKRVKVEFEEKALTAVVALSRVEFPPVLVEIEIDGMIEDQARRFQMQGGDLAAYLKSINKTAEQLHEEMHPAAEQKVARSLVLGKLSESENIVVTDLDIDTEVETILKSAGENKESMRKMLHTPPSRQSVRQYLLTRQTIDRLAAIATDSGRPARKKKKEEANNEPQPE